MGRRPAEVVGLLVQDIEKRASHQHLPAGRQEGREVSERAIPVYDVLQHLSAEDKVEWANRGKFFGYGTVDFQHEIDDPERVLGIDARIRMTEALDQWSERLSATTNVYDTTGLTPPQ